MAILKSTSDSKILTETALTNFSVNASQGSQMPGTTTAPSGTTYNLSLSYADSEFIVNDKGEKQRVISQGLNQKWVNYTPEALKVKFDKPITVDGLETTFGAYLLAGLDADIQEDLSRPAPAGPGSMMAA